MGQALTTRRRVDSVEGPLTGTFRFVSGPGVRRVRSLCSGVSRRSHNRPSAGSYGHGIRYIRSVQLRPGHDGLCVRWQGEGAAARPPTARSARCHLSAKRPFRDAVIELFPRERDPECGTGSSLPQQSRMRSVAIDILQGDEAVVLRYASARLGGLLLISPFGEATAPPAEGLRS